MRDCGVSVGGCHVEVKDCEVGVREEEGAGGGDMTRSSGGWLGLVRWVRPAAEDRSEDG